MDHREEENQAPGLGLSRPRGAGRRFPRSRQRARWPVRIPASGSLRLPPHIPGGGPASRPRLEHLGPDLVPSPVLFPTPYRRRQIYFQGKFS